MTRHGFLPAKRNRPIGLGSKFLVSHTNRCKFVCNEYIKHWVKSNIMMHFMIFQKNDHFCSHS